MKIIKWLRAILRGDHSGVDDEDSSYAGDEASGARLDALGAIGAMGNPPVMPQDDRPRH